MKKAIFAVGAIISAIALIFKKSDFGALPTASDRREYKKRCSEYNGRRFKYPTEWEEKGLNEDLRLSEKGSTPKDELPIYTPDFSSIGIDKINVTWIGHSTVLMQMHGMNILFDPMFSERSSPFQWIGPKRFTRPSVNIKELPHLDIVMLSHDHYDHLDRCTIQQLANKTDRFIVSLGLEKHLEHWNIPSSKITTLAWWEQVNINGLEIICTPSRHFSERGLIRQNRTQWCSWVLKDEFHSIFNSCDGSIGRHFKSIHDKYGDFDLALMECGQYNKSWHYSHLYPEEAVMAAEIIGAKKVMPIHWGAFVLSSHGWDDSPERFVIESEKRNMCVITSHICETFSLDAPPVSNYWWRKYN